MEIREAREKAGMTIQELAEKVGVSAAAICRYEQGKRIPKTPIAKRIANELGLVWYELIDIKRGA